MTTTKTSTITIGEFEVTAVSDGTLYSNHDIVLGLDRAETVKLTGIAQGQPVPLDVNCFLIRHGRRLMISDAGSGHTMGPTLGKLPENLRAIGVDPASIDTILMTHLHRDHSLGLVDEQGRPHFPNAEIWVHDTEATYWIDRVGQPNDPERIQRNTAEQRRALAPYRDRIRRIFASEVYPGITAVLRPGHTPGHTNFLIQSGGKRLLLWGDIVHLTSVQIARPDAALIFDYDPVLAQTTRRQVFEWVVGEGVMVAGAHVAFPGFGSLERSGQGYRFQAGR